MEENNIIEFKKRETQTEEGPSTTKLEYASDFVTGALEAAGLITAVCVISLFVIRRLEEHKEHKK